MWSCRSWPSDLKRWLSVPWIEAGVCSSDRRRTPPPPRPQHRAPSLNSVVPQHPPPSHRLRRAGRNVAVGPDGDPLRVHRRRVGLEVTELLLLLGIQPPLTTSLFWRLVKAAVLVGHTPVLSQTGWHTEPCAMKRLLLLLTPLLVSANPVSAWERFDPDEGYKNCVDTALREWLDQEKWRSLNRVEKSAYKSLAHQRCNSSVPEQFQTDMGK